MQMLRLFDLIQFAFQPTSRQDLIGNQPETTLQSSCFRRDLALFARMKSQFWHGASVNKTFLTIFSRQPRIKKSKQIYQLVQVRILI